MSDKIECPYCGTTVDIKGRDLSYDEKAILRCPSCGGRFEYMEGFGAFSLPDDESVRQPRIYYEGSYPSGSHDSWKSEPGPTPEQNCSKCCEMCVCLIILFMLIPFFTILSRFWW